MTVLLVILALLINAANRESLPPESASCLGCHERVSLVKVDSMGIGFSVPLTEKGFRESDHGSLSCIQCHGESFAHVPHLPPGASTTLSCDSCHGTEPAPCSHLPFNEYLAAQGGDIHVTRLRNFSCGACHEPHSSSISRCAPPQQTNESCLRCHPMRELNERHLLFPGAGLHLRQMSCTRCHFPLEAGGSEHFVLPASSSLRDCRICHSRRLADATFGQRIDHWAGRRVPGWGYGLVAELIFVVVVLLLLIALHLRRVLRTGAKGFTRIFALGPAAKIRGIAMLLLLVTGAGIYFGGGWALSSLCHVHLLAGVVLLAVCAARLLLPRGVPHPRYLSARFFRAAILSLLLATGVLLLIPSITSMFDGLVPWIRELHRFSGVLLLLWLVFATGNVGSS